MADDMGYGDVGCYNPESRIPTPNMDRLAANGTIFTDAHAPSSVCTPTRYGVLTGRYCWRTRLKQGVTGGYEAPLIEAGRPTVASILKGAGYHTACIGKWHVGLTFRDRDGNPTENEADVDFTKPVEGGPADLGFDYAYYNAGCGTCAPPYGFIEGRSFVDPDFTFHETGKASGPAGVGGYGQWPGMKSRSWVTEDADPTIAEKACAYIEERASGDQPFFLYLAPNAPHEPCVERFVPEFARGKSKAGARGDLVWLFDWIVGRVADVLKTTGQIDNTLLIITSDNGALPGDFKLDKNGTRLVSDDGRNEYRYNLYDHKSNADWRGYKAHIWEGGHRMPFIAHWPAAVPAAREAHELICLTDFIATCASVAGTELPDTCAEDSCDILPALLGRQDKGTPARTAVIHHSSFGVFSIRQGDWKLVLDCSDSGGWPTPRGTPPVPGSKGQLYDLSTDPGECHNLWDEHPEIVGKMSALLTAQRTANRSKPNPVP